MSGHSKWSTIKRQKGVADAKRGQQFTKLSSAITLAVRQGGGLTDPNGNFKLRLAIDRARSFNMPKENIERAIARATGKHGAVVEEAMYEGFAPGGVAVLIEAVTDNKMRTVSEVKNVLEKNGGTLGSSGSVSYLFNRVGEVVARLGDKSFDDVFSTALDSGAEDIQEEGNKAIIYTQPADVFKTKTALEAEGIEVEDTSIVYDPTTSISVADENTRNRIIGILEKLEEIEDVQQVYSNLDM